MRMSFRLVIFGGLIIFLAVATVAVFVPALIWKPQQTVIAHEYTPQQERGRHLFYSNGCNYCHTQYVRVEDTAMGAPAAGGNYVFDNPMTLGSERTGPDLSYVGRKRSRTWEIEHLKNPRTLSPLSIMPNWVFLSDADLNALADYLFALGDRTAAARMILPPTPYAQLTDPQPFPVATPVAADQSQGWATWTLGGLQEGKEKFVKNCLTCHGPTGNGLGNYGGTLAVTPADWKQDPFRKMSIEEWFWHVSEGVPGTVMPTWKTSLTEDERWKIIRYVRDTFSRPIMRDPDEGDPPPEYAGLTSTVPITQLTLDDGKTIYSRECAVCHGFAGRSHGPYAEGLQPSPADFGDGSYGPPEEPKYPGDGYFWRISEGLPWSAMPAWKDQYSVDDRWKLANFIQVNFTQIISRPVMTALPIRQTIYLEQTMPATASFERGRALYLTTCAQCHGLNGQGDGWNGGYLNLDIAPLSTPPNGGLSDGEYFERVSFGMPNVPMLAFGEFLPESQRWDVIRFIKDAFVTGRPVNSSLFGAGEVGVEVLTLSQDNWLADGNVISVTNGSDIYATYCAVCHGDQGQGAAPNSTKSPSGVPAAFPAGLDPAYAFWRVFEGAPDSTMYPFRELLKDSDIWDVVTFLGTITGKAGG